MKPGHRGGGKGWLLCLAGGLLFCMAMGLFLAWCNIERSDINYRINIEHEKLQERLALQAKLVVERDRLLSPYELRLRAEKLGMRKPSPGQIRQMGGN